MLEHIIKLKFDIAEVVRRRGTTENFLVLEQLLQICPGGVQLKYEVTSLSSSTYLGGEEVKRGLIPNHYTMLEIELEKMPEEEIESPSGHFIREEE